ncbi:carboxymuconolactone decarboxylase family protein [Leptospira gomenensis]|uniref:Carboxymuconolactone decarboxylase family protein n=1 Tax=Leptospira gomenensis TaxID=2484974 RepID=A0A5F1YB04_9LEPT|nr:carboxymuconolactone decarboxylase family protein [Leptospira gomenensis]TGK34445.1 carboxymuconolactone decarboxylase family protein [Leptospira gomenensis]TGK34994.1 carboxymuconolactone decarboxylase family protein [Leptospira gomenensis]TGK41831.1 carboxymuconolactone decarboxylase family protein [Leptospira gomenensis]TGK65155.1 carboxymuconolactone decarboxylase family protein [Leptospira gomenensis]
MTRLKPIDRPASLLMRVVYWMSKRRFGKVLALFNVLYVRSSPLLFVATKIISTEKKLSLSADTKLHIRSFVSYQNKCEYCSNLAEYTAQKETVEFQKVKELMNFRVSNLYSEKEKALFLYLEEICLTKFVKDETFNGLRRFYDEKEIVEITWLSATEHYFNLLAEPLGMNSDELKV